MNSPRSVLHIARVVLEAETPLSISTGSPDGVFDTALVTDANGLPAIPGTAFAGVLRHLWVDTYGQGDESSADDLFGMQKGSAGTPSRVLVSWGALLDSNGRPVEGLLLGPDQARLEDPLLKAAASCLDEPVFRNRVRLTHKGAAADGGKFDRAVLPAGHRFACELRLWSGQVDDLDWDKLLALLNHPGLRLGGATRAGLGKMRLDSAHRRSFALASGTDIQAFCNLGPGLADTSVLEPCQPRSPQSRYVTGILHLEARGFWRIGQGDTDLLAALGRPTAEKPADLLPVTEERIEWNGGKGTHAPRALLLPAASLKGALAHRFIFHTHRFAQRWATEAEDPHPCPEAEALFGTVKDENSGRAGCLYIDDAFVPIEPDRIGRLMHNAIDRFTGGVRDRVLYSEESLYQGSITVPIVLDVARLQRSGGTEGVRRAFKAALDDFCCGRLALGSRTTAGNGFFTARIEGDLRAWLEAPATQGEVA